MGLRFDWALLDGVRHPLPWALSGGLTPANVAEAIQRTGARLVDVSSGVETTPGVTDMDKITAFLKAASRSCPPIPSATRPPRGTRKSVVLGKSVTAGGNLGVPRNTKK